MSRESKLAKNTLVLSIGTLLPKLTTFITLPILTGCLTKEDMGAYDLVTVLVSLLLPTATLQIQTAAFRFLLDLRNNEGEIKKVITNIIGFTLPTSVVALVIVFFCLYSQTLPVRIWICLYFFADILVNTGRQICRGLGNNIDYAISAIVSSVCKMIFAVVCVYFLRWELVGTIIALFASSFFSLIYLLIRVKLYKYISINCLDKNLLSEMLKYTWPLVPNGMSAWIMRLSDRLIILAVLGLSENAIYAVANKIPSLLNIAQNTFTMAWQENASIVSKDVDASQYYSKMFQVMFNLMSGFFGLLIAATPILFKLLIRGDYGEAYNQMPLLFVGMFFLSMSTFLGGVYVAYKKSKNVGITTMIAAVINLAIDIGTIKWIGLYAASGSTLLAYLFLFIYRSFDVQKIVYIRIDWKHFLIVLSILFLESLICYMRNPMLNYVNVVIAISVFISMNKTITNRIWSLMKKKIRNRI